jgi:hypothetical protein
MLTVLGGLAEFERHLILTRTTEGRVRAMARGVKFGRRPKLTKHQRTDALARIAQGETLTAVARESRKDLDQAVHSGSCGSRKNSSRGVIEVREALEETNAHGIRFKAAKIKAGRRDITLPDIALQALSEQRKRLLETRMKLGLGKLGGDDLLFANLEGKPLRPSAVSSDWGELASACLR